MSAVSHYPPAHGRSFFQRYEHQLPTHWHMDHTAQLIALSFAWQGFLAWLQLGGYVRVWVDGDSQESVESLDSLERSCVTQIQIVNP